MKFRTFAAIFFATAIVIFSLQNTEVTDVKFLTWKVSMSRVLVILGSFILGIIVGILIKKKKRIHY
ncbi:lipopolysaccharide assembly protein LapA domain-containing protein [Sabulilitoribacter multivorans]|uniref:Lipopolysaccharide assembly protein LapA domain-containing protein n=1 Tax=Flaviramulus multivorans TaxID=1304750 RepID=A0ABS9IJ82_9FLAO|nr:lipopolysaccharide assembly protein LapA domain-containing protein [Flaviramulus multivorans]MCF7560646.1 lipopolysaccharide assembly protein LapA domain-containing protein [Flaviramulus multivorans]